MQETLDGLATDPRTLHLAGSLVLAERQPATRLLLVVDQFEEVFTLCRDERERGAFFANLLYAAAVPGGGSRVVARRCAPTSTTAAARTPSWHSSSPPSSTS